MSPNPSAAVATAEAWIGRLARVRVAAPLFALVALGVYAPALSGPFLSDDLGYVLHNLYIQSLEPGRVLALFAPFGEPARFTANYAPVHLLGHAMEWAAFGAATPGYHVVNVLLHALASALLIPLFVRLRISRAGAFGLAALFLLHPANVEAVAWIFQLKTILALLFSTAALLLFPTRPVWALLAFGLAMAAKVHALFAIPVAATLLVVEQGVAALRGRRAAWLAGWLAAALLVAVPGFAHFQAMGHVGFLAPYASFDVQLRSIAAIAARYLVLAATGLGASAFHEPAPASSWLDPWWLAGAAALVLLGVRLVVTLRARRPEAVGWLWAAAAWAPISQIFPFLYPMGDRYLYLILPGLLAGAALGLAAAVARLRTLLGRRSETTPRGWGTAAGALVLVAAVVFAAAAYGRARIWRSEVTLTLDAALHYPEGTNARFLAARRAAVEGDVAAASEALGKLADRGYEGFIVFQNDPAFAPLANDPRFQRELARIAGNWIEAVQRRDTLLQADLRTLALAHLARGEPDAALEALDAAVAARGPLDEVVRAERDALRRSLGAAGSARGTAPEPRRGLR